MIKKIIFSLISMVVISLAIALSKPSCGVTMTSIVHRRVLASQKNLEQIFQYIEQYRREHNGLFPHGNNSREVFCLLVKEFDIAEEVFIDPLFSRKASNLERDKIINRGYRFNMQLAGKKYNGKAIPLLYSLADSSSETPNLILFTDGVIK